MATFSAFWALAHVARGHGPPRPPPLDPPVIRPMCLSEHSLVMCQLYTACDPLTVVRCQFRDTRLVDLDAFQQDF